MVTHVHGSAMTIADTPSPAAGVPGAPGTPGVPGVVDAGGRVVAEVPCRRCSYVLRGLHVNARCPECGAPVGVAVHGPLLRYGDPQWVRNLSRGAGVYFWGIIVGILLGIVAGLFVLAVGKWVAPVLGMIGQGVALYGAWLLTEPDPSGIGEDQYGLARRVIRLSLLCGVVQFFINFSTGYAQFSRELTVTLMVASGAASLLNVMGQFAMLRYLERLAQRIPNPRHSARARFLFWAYGGALAFVVLLGGVIGIAGYLAAGRGMAPGTGAVSMLAGLACLMVPVGIALVVFLVMFLVLLYRLQVAFDEQAKFAQYAWAKVEGGRPPV